MSAEKTPGQLAQEWEALTGLGPHTGSLWRHYLGGLYRVLGLALREEDATPCVVYRKAFTDAGQAPAWVCRLERWKGRVQAPGGEEVPRFEPVEGAFTPKDLEDSPPQ